MEYSQLKQAAQYLDVTTQQKGGWTERVFGEAPIHHETGYAYGSRSTDSLSHSFGGTIGYRSETAAAEEMCATLAQWDAEEVINKQGRAAETKVHAETQESIRTLNRRGL